MKFWIYDLRFMINDFGKEQQSVPEEQTRERVIQVNEWFAPFTNYEDIPYIKRVDKAHYKRFPFIINSVGEISMMLLWSQRTLEAEKREAEGKHFLVLPGGSSVVNSSKLLDLQSRMEARLLTLWIHACEEFNSQNFPYNVQVKSVDGSVVELTSSPTKDGNFMFVSGEDLESKDKFDFVAIPEIEAILNKVQMKVVPKE